MRTIKTFGVAAMLAVLGAAPLQAQTEPGRPDPPEPLIGSMLDGAAYVQDMFTEAADQMAEEDYAFKPTPDVRSFGQLLAHVADANYTFCAAAQGEEAPVREVEKTVTTREGIRKALSESFAYCDGAYRTITDADPKTMIDFMGRQRSPAAVLNFRIYHSLLHYGNAITYMRLRGKVPPSSQLTQAN